MRKNVMTMILSALLIVSLSSGCGSDLREQGSTAAMERNTIAEPAKQREEAVPKEEPVEEAKLPENTTDTALPNEPATLATTENFFLPSTVPAYSGDAYVVINGNMPYFDTENLTTDSYESYSTLDALGRCGVVMANVGLDTMPTEERGSISHIKPTGWHSVQYDTVEGGYLYNRCRLIGFQLTGENANERNLITGTRYLNIEGMLPFENKIADYIDATGNHVTYRVTPIYEESNLLVSGVLMEDILLRTRGEVFASVSMRTMCSLI